ncbi:tripartite tricarboxylate transporter substrate-binding protein [Terrarubrum flagellatum]|uniref:tripartite tricarboxylate transporter substrate-binding protein n=1 Tax=Terrirubrum flagellatum TaxID=2895980 RepID=UPI00314552FA
MKFLLKAAGAALLAGLLTALPAKAQNYPEKPITLIVPFAAGGPTDVIARLLGVVMGQKLGQQIIIENIAGAGGTTAAGRVARMAPDGYTLLIHHIALPLGASLYKNLPYDTATAFEPLGLINYGPYVLTTKLDYPAKTPAELFDSFRKNAAKITFAHAGVGSGSHLCGLVLMQALGFKSDFVAYRGTGPALNDVVAGQVDVLCDQTTNTFPQIAAKTIKAFAITSAQRSPQFKDIPTMAEVGLPTLDVNVWHGLYAPRGTPVEILNKVHAALQEALADKTVLQRFDDLGTLPFPENERSREAHGKKLTSELMRLRAVVQSAGIEAVSN